MNDFYFNINYGFNHVLDVNGYDHLLFLALLAVPYLFKDWKRVLLLVSLFTFGHTLSLVFAAYNVLTISSKIVEFLIPITIFVAAVYNIMVSKRNIAQQKIGLLLITSLFFGIIHGLGFGREFKMVFGGASNKLLALIEFAIGIELAQLIIVFIVLFFGFLFQTVFRYSKRDWILVVSSIIIGLVLPILKENNIF